MNSSWQDCCGCCFDPRWTLKHFVWINMSGKTVLIFGGLMLTFYPGLSQATTWVGCSNALIMALGQCWYSHYWTVGAHGGIDNFLKGDSQHALLRWQNACVPQPFVWTLAASLYYCIYFGLFEHVRQQESNQLAVAYATAAEIWHGLGAVFLIFTSVLLWHTPSASKTVPYTTSSATTPSLTGLATPPSP